MDNSVADYEILSRIIVDPRFESICPALTDDEFKLLEENVLSDGAVTSPLIIWNGFLIDGHNRRKIILKHPELRFSVVEKQFENEFQAIVWICKNQIGRRNLTEQHRTYLLGKQYDAEKRAVGGQEGNQNRSGGRRCQNDTFVLDGLYGKTYDRIAKENGVSGRTVARSAEYSSGVDAAEEISPGIRKEILSGSLPIKKKELIALGKAPAEERRQMVDEILHPKDAKQSKSKLSPAKVNPDYYGIEAISSEMEQVKAGNNIENVLGVIHCAAKEFQWTCQTNISEFPELLTGERHRLMQELSGLKHYLDTIFEGGNE